MENARRALGTLLVLLGAVLLVSRFVDLAIGRLWPAFVIVPGLVLTVLGLSGKGRGGEALTVTGSSITVVGLILLYQDTADHFESWAYAWTLVWPFAFGLGSALQGVRTGRRETVRTGSTLMLVGLGLFLLGVAFFEGVIGISGRGLGRGAEVALAALLIAFGVVLVARPRREPPVDPPS